MSKVLRTPVQSQQLGSDLGIRDSDYAFAMVVFYGFEQGRSRGGGGTGDREMVEQA